MTSTAPWTGEHIRGIDVETAISVDFVYTPERYAALQALAERCRANDWSRGILYGVLVDGVHATFRATFGNQDNVLNTTHFIIGLGSVP